MVERYTRKANEYEIADESKLKGRRMYVKRPDKKPIRVNLYQPESEEPLPVVFAAHGGQFIDGDADDIDSFCDRIAKEWNCNVVSISYTRVKAHVTTYPQDEIHDTVEYFYKHADEYGMDMTRYLLLGFEAGAYLSLIADLNLVQSALVPRGIIMIDPFIDYVAVSFAQAGIHPGPAALVLTGTDTDKADEYEFAVRQAGVEIHTRRMPNSTLAVLMSEDPDNETDRLNQENTMRWLKDTAQLFLR